MSRHGSVTKCSRKREPLACFLIMFFTGILFHVLQCALFEQGIHPLVSLLSSMPQASEDDELMQEVI